MAHGDFDPWAAAASWRHGDVSWGGGRWSAETWAPSRWGAAEPASRRRRRRRPPLWKRVQILSGKIDDLSGRLDALHGRQEDSTGFSDEVSVALRSFRELMDKELKDIRDQHTNGLKDVNDLVGKESTDRKLHLDELRHQIDALRDLRELMNQELTALNDLHDKGLKDVNDLVGRETGILKLHIDDLRSQVDDIHRAESPFAKQIPGLHTQLNDLGDLLHRQVKDQKGALGKHKSDTADSFQKLQHATADLAKRLETEASARGGILDEVERTQTLFRTEVRGLLNDEANTTKSALDDLQGALADLRNETQALDADLSKLKATTEDHRTPEFEQLQPVLTNLDSQGKDIARLERAIQDQKDALGKHKNDTTDTVKMLQQATADLAKKLAAETSARCGILEELEQTYTLFQTEVRGLLHDAADKTKAAPDDQMDALDDLKKREQARDDDRNTLAEQIKGLQRKSPEARLSWWRFCDELQGGVRDPNRHDGEVLQAFLAQYSNSSSSGSGSAEQTRRRHPAGSPSPRRR